MTRLSVVLVELACFRTTAQIPLPMTGPVYLDYMSTTPLDPRARAAMDAVYDQGPANPHSTTHAFGWTAAEAVDRARREIAALIGAGAHEIIFTSGATEANNLAIAGAAKASGKRHLVVTAVEHPCVLETARALEREGCSVTEVGVDGQGVVDPDDIERALTDDTALVAVMLANNETGVLQPVARIGRICRERGVLLHTDAVQSAGRMAIDAADLKVDLLSLSAHKMYGPMGIGALYMRGGVKLARQLHGGAQQGGMRSGTVPAALAAGFGEAARLAREELERDTLHLAALADMLCQKLRAGCESLVVSGEDVERLPGSLHVRGRGVNAQDWLLATPDVAASAGAACASADRRPSHVLTAMGLTPQEASGAIRLSVGRTTTEEDVDRAAASLVRSYAAMAANVPAGPS